MTQVLDAVDRLRQAAGDQTLVSRNLRIGTVNAANSTLLVPAVQDFRRHQGGTGVEVLSTQQSEIYQGLAEGSLDLGLVNVLPGDDVPPHLDVARAGPRPPGRLPAHRPPARRRRTR